MSQNVPLSIVMWELFLMKTKSLWGHSCAFYDILAASNRAAKKWALSLTYHLIKSLEEWVDDSQRAFPKAVSGCLLHFPSAVLSRSPRFSLVLSNVSGLFCFRLKLWYETHEPDPPASSALQMPADPGGHRRRHRRAADQRDRLLQHGEPSTQPGVHHHHHHHPQLQGDLRQRLLLHPDRHVLLLLPRHDTFQVPRQRRGQEGPLWGVHKRRAAVSAEIQHRPHGGEVWLWRGEQPVSHGLFWAEGREGMNTWGKMFWQSPSQKNVSADYSGKTC